MFFHDSLHTPEHMRFEFDAAWPHVAPGGVLASDDAFRKQEFPLLEFAAGIGLETVLFGNKGFVRKPPTVGSSTPV